MDKTKYNKRDLITQKQIRMSCDSAILVKRLIPLKEAIKREIDESFESNFIFCYLLLKHLDMK